MEQVVFRIWGATSPLLSLKEATEAEQKSAVLSKDQALELVMDMYKTCFSNATIEDAQDATRDMFTTVGELNFAWLSKFVEDVVIGSWASEESLDPSSLPTAPTPALTNAPEGSNPVNSEIDPITLAKVQFMEQVCRCIVDDRPPCGLLPFDEVMTVAKPREIETYFSSYVKLTDHPKHSPVFDTMWSELLKEEKCEVSEAAAGICLSTYTRWFNVVYCSLFSNATENRASVTAKHQFNEAVALFGTIVDGAHISFTTFMYLCQKVCSLYAKREDTVTFYTQFVSSVQEHVQRTQEENDEAELEEDKRSTAFYDMVISPITSQTNDNCLVDPVAIHVLDNLNETDHLMNALYRTPSSNRILVVGKQGVGKTTLSKKLAERLNVPFIDVQSIATTVSADENDEFFAQVTECVKSKKAFPAELKANLIKRALQLPATVHKGYVLGDLPCCTGANDAQSDEYVRNIVGLMTSDFPPQVIVDISCEDSIYNWWYDGVYKKNAQQLMAVELQLRKEEKAEVDQAESENAAKEERMLRRQQWLDRKAQIEAGEIQLSEEEAAAEAELEEPPEEPEEEPATDEEGNPLEPEVIEQRAKEKKSKSERRRFLADMQEVFWTELVEQAGKQVHTCLQLPALSNLKEICASRGRLIQVSCLDSTSDQTEFIVKKLRMSPSAVPIEPVLNAEDTEGVEAGAEGDITIAEMKTKALLEGTSFDYSRWKKFCPVTWFDDGVLVEGSMAYSCEYRSFVYCFASPSKLQRFLDAPHPFLLSTVSINGPLLLMKKNLHALGDDVSAAALEEKLSETLGLTITPLSDFTAQWGAYNAEVKRRAEIVAKRAAADDASRLEREERYKKILEAEMKKKKGEKKKKKAKEAEQAADLSAGLQENTMGEETEAENVAPHVETTEERILKLIAEEKKKKKIFFPQLVSCLDEISEESLTMLFDYRVLPTTMIVFDCVKPRPPGEEEDEEEPAEEDEEDVAMEEPELNEDGEEIVKEKVPKVVDLTDNKQYKKLIAKLLAKFQASTDSASEAVEPEEGVPATLPLQSFNILSSNTFGKKVDELTQEIAHTVSVVCEPAMPLGDDEEIIQDPEVDPDEEVLINPLSVPGKKAVHQFGGTLKYCPVTLKRNKVLVVGDSSINLKFNGKKYLFSTTQAMEDFRRNPMMYVPPVPCKLPPPRLWIIGVSFSGKNTLAKTLCQKYGLRLFKFDTQFFLDVMAAATAENGGSVDGMFIPNAQDNSFLKRATTLHEELIKFDESQVEKATLKEKTQQEQNEREALRDAGEEVEELDEEEEAEIQKILEFEPEEPEAREERLSKAHRQIAAALLRLNPFETDGYVMCGHAANEAELETLLEEGAYPEAVLSLKLSPETFVARKEDVAYEAQVEEWKQKVNDIAAKKKQHQIKQREIELRKWRRRNIGADDEPEETGDGEDIEDMEDPEAPTREAVKTDLEATYDNEFNAVSAVTGVLPDKRIPVVELNGDSGVETVLLSCCDKLRAVLEDRRSLLEAPLIVSFDEAQTFLSTGRKLTCSFQFSDPVSLYDERRGKSHTLKQKKKGSTVIMKEDIIPDPEPPAPKPKKKRMVTKENEDGEEIEVEEEYSDHDEEEEEEPVDDEPEPEPEPELSPEELDEMRLGHETRTKKRLDKKKMKAVVLRNRIFFLNSEETLLRFMMNPLKYWDQPALEEDVSTLVAVYEAVPDGDISKRLIAHHIAQSGDLVFLDIPKLLKWCLKKTNITPLSESAKNCVLNGAEVSTEFLNTALVARLQTAECQIRGTVLLNLPRSSLVLHNLKKNMITIDCALSFSGHLYDHVVEEIDRVSKVSHNVQFETHTTSALVESMHHIYASIHNRQQLAIRRSLGFPAPVANATVLESYITGNLSHFSFYCPYMWLYEKQLFDMSGDRRYTTEYLGKMYCFASEEHQKLFLANPAAFSGEHGEKCEALPSILPKWIEGGNVLSEGTTTDNNNNNNNKQELELCGCCPVTLYHTRHNIGLKGVTEPTAIRGDTEKCLVEYDGKKYAMKDEELLQRFLRQPWVYSSGAVLPSAQKLPMDKEKVRKLDGEMYVTHTFYDNIARAMLAVAEARPKFPGLSVEESALKFVALHLKAHNGENTEIKESQFKENFENFSERATLYKTITTEAPTDAVELERFHHLCRVWDEVQDDQECYKEYISLKNTTEAASKERRQYLCKENKMQCLINYVEWDEGEADLRTIRTEVFVEEQKIDPTLEFEVEVDRICRHLIARDVLTNAPMGCLRIDPVSDKNDTLKISRVAVRKKYRRQGVAKKLLEEALHHISSQHKGIRTIILNAQVEAHTLYLKAGFSLEGEVFIEEETGIPHYHMKYELPSR